jgi:hypothetical protein
MGQRNIEKMTVGELHNMRNLDFSTLHLALVINSMEQIPS